MIALCVLMLGTFSFSVAHAQDPRETVVQASAREWLALTDRLDADASWKASGEKFKQAITSPRWGEALYQVRQPLGAVQQRALVSTGFNTQFSGVSGEYALVQFRTAFEKKSEGHESVTLELERDGKWRVIGYFIR